jgi:hypothetical protein
MEAPRIGTRLTCGGSPKFEPDGVHGGVQTERNSSELSTPKSTAESRIASY